MIPGYNHNVKYDGNVFHVQTEDSGRKKGHIITHLYFGGNIIVSRKTQYGQLVDHDDCDDRVSNLMKQQHKDILRGLVNGTFDVRITERSGGASFLDGPAPLNVDAGSQSRASFSMPTASTEPTEASRANSTPEQILASQKTNSDAKATASTDVKQFDGTFTVEDSLWEALLKAAPVILAEDLQNALDAGDDDFVFGGEQEEQRLDDMMLAFMKDT